MTLDDMRAEFKAKWEPMFRRIGALVAAGTRHVPRDILGCYLASMGVKMAKRAGVDDATLREVVDDALKTAAAAPAPDEPSRPE